MHERRIAAITRQCPRAADGVTHASIVEMRVFAVPDAGAVSTGTATMRWPMLARVGSSDGRIYRVTTVLHRQLLVDRHLNAIRVGFGKNHAAEDANNHGAVRREARSDE